MYGANIKNIRERKRITQEGLAKKLGVSRQAVCMWETDKRELNGTMLNRMAQAFNVSVSDILSEGGAVFVKKAPTGEAPGKLSLNRGGRSMRNALASIAGKKGKEESTMKKGTQKTTFALAAPQASRVSLTGSFNSWNKSGEPLKKDKNGTWKADLSLKPGRYEYKFIVDGQWWTDPANRSTIRNSFGTENSLIEIKG